MFVGQSSHSLPQMPAVAMDSATATTNAADANFRANSAGRLPTGSRHQRIERNQNWQVTKTLILIQAKRTQHFRENNIIDP